MRSRTRGKEHPASTSHSTSCKNCLNTRAQSADRTCRTRTGANLRICTRSATPTGLGRATIISTRHARR
eukprot:8164872-Alexandrium_andersonii.AAC.1